MATTLDFTEQQRSLIEGTGSVYVEACPGAGKTQAIVQRFVDRPSVTDERRGVALLSFTNAAVDEARSRCASAPHLLQVPNFAGTIDAFINRFIVSPTYTARTGRTPLFRDTWSSVPMTQVTVPGVRGIFALDWFDITVDGVASLVLQRVPAGRRPGAQSLRVDELRRVTDAAAAKWQAMFDRGVLDAATSRRLMVKYLQDDATRRKLVCLLGARFTEVIVDEVQDCTASDALILELIEEAGSKLVCVGDPDQAIYGFRDSESSMLSGLLSRLAVGNRLDGNFRSAPAICSAVGSLRQGSSVDVAVGDMSTVSEPVTVAVYRRPADVKAIVSSVLSDRGIPESDIIVLAHAAATSRSCAGGSGSTRPTDSRLVNFALAIHRFQAASSPPSARREALRKVQSLVCELGGDDESEADFLEARGLTERLFADRCLRIVLALTAPFEADPSAFKEELCVLLRLHGVLDSNSSMLRTPNGDKWPFILGQDVTALRHSTIHGYKGLQHRAVALVLPKAASGVSDVDGVSQWLSGEPGESRRVLYVGASRAQELLILVIHESRMDDVVGRMSTDGVPHIVWADPEDPGGQRR